MELGGLWDRVIRGMERRIGHQDVEIWLRQAHPVGLDGERLSVEVANRYYADWINDNYLTALQEEASAAAGLPMSLTLVYDDAGEGAEPTPSIAPDAVDRTPRAIGVNHGQTFENFVVGACNQFAHAAAQAVADFPAQNYNPLFIYGATGLGKTHLMHAIANYVLGRNPNARVLYVTAEDFMNEMINFIRWKRMDDFRAKYRRRATVLLVDDVQFLSGRERTQEEFFHTFNALQTSGRQIVLTADVQPRDIEALEPRLRTRFEGGLLADMQAPDRETLTAILLKKAEGLRLAIQPDLADAIANAVRGNIRSLEGLLNRLAALQTLYNDNVTLEFARKHLPGTFDPPTPTVSVSAIIEAVARFHNLRGADLTGGKKTRTLVRPRHIAMFLARKHTTLSFPELGREFGDRDHSTIQHGVRKIEKEVEEDPDLQYKVKLIETGLFASRRG